MMITNPVLQGKVKQYSCWISHVFSLKFSIGWNMPKYPSQLVLPSNQQTRFVRKVQPFWSLICEVMSPKLATPPCYACKIPSYHHHITFSVVWISIVPNQVYMSGYSSNLNQIPILIIFLVIFFPVHSNLAVAVMKLILLYENQLCLWPCSTFSIAN